MADTVLFAISFAPEVSFVKVLLRDLPNIVIDKKEWVTIQFHKTAFLCICLVWCPSFGFVGSFVMGTHRLSKTRG